MIPTGYRFVEHDERLAVMRSRRWQQTQVKPASVRIGVDDVPDIDHTAI